MHPRNFKFQTQKSPELYNSDPIAVAKPKATEKGPEVEQSRVATQMTRLSTLVFLSKDQHLDQVKASDGHLP